MHRSDELSESSSPAQVGNPNFHILRAIGFLAFYTIWSSLTFPRSSGWRADLRVAILTQTGWRPSSVEGNTKPSSIPQDTATLFKTDGDGLETPGIIAMESHQQHRIPCGLIFVQDDRVPVSSSTTSSEEEDEEYVLPLATSAIVPVDDTTQISSISNSDAPSTLHARALARYPRLQSYVVMVPPSSSPRDEATRKHFRRMIPPGTFRLRMGSEESTIEDSPPLWIIEDDDDDDDDYENSGTGTNTKIDLILGTTFWKNHQAIFGSDEVYLYPTPSLSETNGGDETRKGSRVMVPYLRIRSRPSFGMEDL